MAEINGYPKNTNKMGNALLMEIQRYLTLSNKIASSNANNGTKTIFKLTTASIKSIDK